MNTPTDVRPRSEAQGGRAAPDPEVTSRHRALIIAASSMRATTRSVSRGSVLLGVGSLLVPVGVALILLGWEGAAHTTVVVEQNSYMISGGILGAVLAALGGFAYLGYWLDRSLEQMRSWSESAQRREADTLKILARIDDRLAEVSMEVSIGHDDVGRRPTLVATSRGKVLHRSGCAIVARRDGLRTVAPGSPGFTYCPICEAEMLAPKRSVITNGR